MLFLAFRCLLCVVCSLFEFGLVCSLCVMRCSLFVVYWSLIVFGVWCSLLVVCSLFVVRSLLFVAC